MDFSCSSGGLDLCAAISRICFLWLRIYCFGFPDNLFSNRICIPPLPIFAITRRGLVAAFIGGQAVAVTVWPPLGEINGRSGFVWFLRPHCLFWTGMVTAASIGKLHRWIRNFTDVWKLNKTLLFGRRILLFPSSVHRLLSLNVLISGSTARPRMLQVSNL